MKKGLKTLALLLVLAMLFSMAACGSKSETPAQPSAPAANNEPSKPAETTKPAEPAKTEDRHYAVDKDTIVLGVADETPSLTARDHNAVEGSRMNYLTYNGLMELDDNLAPIPCLAESYTVEDQPDGSVKSLTVKQVAELLGHTTSEITEIYYVKRDNSRLAGLTDSFNL